jgi:hypothetical protein
MHTLPILRGTTPMNAPESLVPCTVARSGGYGRQDWGSARPNLSPYLPSHPPRASSRHPTVGAQERHGEGMAMRRILPGSLCTFTMVARWL